MQGASDGAASANLQARLKAIADQAGARVQSVRALELPANEGRLRCISKAHLELVGSVAAIYATLRAIEGRGPYLFVGQALLRMPVAAPGILPTQEAFDRGAARTSMGRCIVMLSVGNRIPGAVIGIAVLLCLDAGLVAFGWIAASNAPLSADPIAETSWTSPDVDMASSATEYARAPEENDPVLTRPIFASAQTI